ncbi:GSCOCG00009927001-RA-CDS [Cotesia congregata]|nr:GSCOCG00009927001-RA-CDS [Cotesia congregata]
MLGCVLSSQFETVCNTNGVNPLVQKALCLLQKSSRENHDSRSAITDLVILGLGQLDHQLGNFVVYVHVLEDSCSVIGDCYVAVRADHQLVQASGAQGCLEDVGDISRRGNRTLIASLPASRF